MIDADELKWLGVSPTLEKYASKASGSSAASIAINAAIARGKNRQTQTPKFNAAVGASIAPARVPASKVDVQAERTSAATAERQRWATVFASDASKGRERHAATLLGCSDSFSAANIITALSKAPTDAQRDRAKASAAAGDVWGKVINRMHTN